MTTILIVEDDDALRNSMARLLTLEGFDTLSASNGQSGLEQSIALKPDLIISGDSMPGMSGIELLSTIRADKAVATIPFILLTALDDRQSMRRGMTAGADDYLSKAFIGTELLDAVNAQIRKRALRDEAVREELAAGEDRLRVAFANSIAGGAAQALLAELSPGAVTEQLAKATVLFSDIRNFTSLAEKLNSADVAELLTQYFERACQPVLKNGGHHVRFIGDGLMAVFTDTVEGSPLPAARRAVSAALAMALTAHEFRGWLRERFPERGLPPFAIGVGIHTGEVTLCRIGTVQKKETSPVGDTVNTAARLESASKELGWTVVASTAVLSEAGEGIQTAASTSLEVRGKEMMVDVHEVTGLITGMADKVHGMATLTERAREISEAVKANSAITARAVKSALDARLFARNTEGVDTTAAIRLKGYRILDQIGSGGMTDVYLAEREADGLAVVLKVLDTRGKKEESGRLARFIQEYALLSRLDDRHVIRIYDQGFTDEHAYIAMEYFERGDVRGLFGPAMTQQLALDIVHQVAQALGAIHAAGVVHRDIKPENVMLRNDGSVALADFGIAKSMDKTRNLGLTQTRHGDVVGTPYYLSPEQAGGKVVTAGSDLYSLGVMMFELLSGKRPYIAESLELLLAKHLHADTPPLPPVHAALQPIVDKLMQKKPALRYRSAAELLVDLDLLSSGTAAA